MITNIIFDMDGTILNTLDDIADSLNATLLQFGYRCLDLDTVRGYVGNGIGKLLERAVPEKVTPQKFADIFAFMTTHYDKNKNNKTAEYDGILELMDILKRRNISMAVVSNKYDNAVKALTKEIFGKYISVAIGESATIPPKPLPYGVWKAMRLMGATAQNSVYIGDSDVDFMTAKNSGLPFIGVTWGFRSKEFLTSLGVLRLADKPIQILDIINTIY